MNSLTFSRLLPGCRPAGLSTGALKKSRGAEPAQPNLKERPKFMHEREHSQNSGTLIPILLCFRSLFADTHETLKLPSFCFGFDRDHLTQRVHIMYIYIYITIMELGP